jgi:hypothetical protein
MSQAPRGLGMIAWARAGQRNARQSRELKQRHLGDACCLRMTWHWAATRDLAQPRTRAVMRRRAVDRGNVGWGPPRLPLQCFTMD